jgi:hypothetical protein
MSYSEENGEVVSDYRVMSQQDSGESAGKELVKP